MYTKVYTNIKIVNTANYMVG